MHRRRRATREELVQRLAGCAPGIDWPAALDALAAQGARVEPPLIEVDEEDPWPTSS